MAGSVSNESCEDRRKEVYAAIEVNTPRWVFCLVLGTLSLLIFGCYSWVYASNGGIATVMEELHVRVSELDKSLAVFTSAANAQRVAAEEKSAELKKALELHTVELRLISNTLIRIEKNGGIK